MSVTYYVALPFVDSEEGPQPGQAVECQSPGEARAKAGGLARRPEHIGAVAFKRDGDPTTGEFTDAVVIERFGVTPDDLALVA